MPEQLNNARIDQLPPLSTALKSYFPIPIRNMDTGVTQRVNIGEFLASPTTQNFEWLSDNDLGYDIDEVVTYGGKWWQSQVPNNLNNIPGTDDTKWLEINKSASGFVVYQPGLFTEDHVFVLYNPAGEWGIYHLTVPSPFVSSDFDAELALGQWELIGGDGTLTKPLANTYANIADLLADQSNQAVENWYGVSNASADITVNSGWAIYEYLGTTNGDLTDYFKRQEQESIDVVINDASETVKGIAELVTQAETDAGTDDTRIVTPLKLASKPNYYDGGSFTSAVDLTVTNRKFIHSIAGAIAYTMTGVYTSDHVGNIREDHLTANGINKPTFSSDFVVIQDFWVNTINTVNVIRFKRLSNSKIGVWLYNV